MMMKKLRNLFWISMSMVMNISQGEVLGNPCFEGQSLNCLGTKQTPEVSLNCTYTYTYHNIYIHIYHIFILITPFCDNCFKCKSKENTLILSSIKGTFRNQTKRKFKYSVMPMIHKYTVIMMIQIQNHSVCDEVERAEYRLKLKMGEMSRSERRPADWTEAWTNSFTRGLNHHHHHHQMKIIKLSSSSPSRVTSATVWQLLEEVGRL